MRTRRLFTRFMAYSLVFAMIISFMPVFTPAAGAVGLSSNGIIDLGDLFVEDITFPGWSYTFSSNFVNVSDDVTITGKAMLDISASGDTLWLIIGNDATVTWQAELSGTSDAGHTLIRIEGSGNFEMTVGSKIELTGNTGGSLNIGGSVNAVISGATISNANRGVTINVTSNANVVINDNAKITATDGTAIMAQHNAIIAINDDTLISGTSDVETPGAVIDIMGNATVTISNSAQVSAFGRRPAIAVGDENSKAIITGGMVSSERNDGSPGMAIALYDNGGDPRSGVAAYLAGTINGTLFITDDTSGTIVEVDTLVVPVSRNATSIGLTVNVGSGSVVWDTAGSVPKIVFTDPDTTLEWGKLTSGGSGGGGGWSGAAPDGINTIEQIFPDPVLAQWVADKLYKDVAFSPLAEDLAGIKSALILQDVEGFADWTGIAFLTGVTSIDLSGSDIAGNISDFAGMTQLEYLTLENLDRNNLGYYYSHDHDNIDAEYGFGIEGDIASLINLTKLKSLDVGWSNAGGDIRDLAALTDLTFIYITCSNVGGDIGDITSLVNLRDLYCDKSPHITGELSDLAAFPNLRGLGLSGSQVSGTLDELTSFTNIEHLNLSGASNITGNISALTGLLFLSEIWIENIDITGDIADLAETGAENSTLNLSLKLSLKGTNVYGDLSKLNLNSFTELNLSNLRITLPSIDFEGSQVSVFVPVKDETGGFIAPQTFSGGTYNPEDGTVTWDIPTAANGTLSYTFSKEVTINEATGIYSGTVYQPYTGGSGGAVKKGDVTGEGQINMQDVLLIYQYFRGKTDLEKDVDKISAADVNGDDEVNMQDVLLVYQYSRGIITEFPIAP